MDKKRIYRRSKQRQRILELLESTGNHPTATWVYDQLRKEYPSLSMGNVYRNLNILVEQGLVKSLDFGSTFDRFDANVTPHYHFICENCGSVIDLEIPIENELNEKVNKATDFSVRYHKMQFYGLCNKCIK
ncbi:MAG: Fur family transcriptional regulator, peroxide stress response regulator [Candidatus Poribacteria bacterium]|nr:Fur family transcriptional regulator, peroxide stress response regulator [Candidatus Poribacteria bacterium]